MVRIGSLFRAVEADINEHDSSGKTIRQQLDEMSAKVRKLINEQYDCIMKEIIPGLERSRNLSYTGLTNLMKMRPAD